jgi:PAS domain S-box-containing protein
VAALRQRVAELERALDDMSGQLDGTDIATLFLDRHLTIRRFTPAAHRLFQLKPSDVGRPIKDIRLRFENGFLVREARRVLRRPERLEHEVPSDDGGWFLCRIQPYRRHGDRVEGVVITFVDITQHREVEQRFRRAEERYRLAADAAGFGTYDFHPATGRSHWSPELHSLMGVSRTNPVDEDLFRSMVHPEDRPAFDAAVASALDPAGPGQHELEYRIIPPRGRVLWVRDTGRSFYTTRGRRRQVERVIGTVQNITQRKELEISLRESEARHRLVTDAMPALISFIDRRRAYQYANAAFEDWFGRSTGEIVGSRLPVIMGSRAFRAIRPFVDRALAGERLHYEKEIPQADGSHRIVRADYIPHRDASGEVIGFFAMVQDVSELKRAERELRALNEQLEARVTERTRELAAAHAATERDIATATEREQQRIAQDLHDTLGQELAATAYLCDSLRDSLSNQDPEVLERFSRISRELSRSVEKVRGIALGLYPVENRPEALKHALRALAENLEATRTVRVRFHCPGEVEIADPVVANGLFRIAQEAVANALRHGRPTRVRIELTARGGRVRLRVEDDGRGIPESVLSGNSPQHGLGMRILRHRASLIGAQLEIGNLPKGGACVACVLSSK